MGVTSYTDDNGQHVSTGKLAPMGERHEPQWGPWRPYDQGWWYRPCQVDWCECEDMSQERPDVDEPDRDPGRPMGDVLGHAPRPRKRGR